MDAKTAKALRELRQAAEKIKAAVPTKPREK